MIGLCSNKLDLHSRNLCCKISKLLEFLKLLDKLEKHIKKFGKVVEALAELVFKIGTLYAAIRFMLDR